MSESLETTAMEERQEQLRELTEFTENCKEKLNHILESLGWSLDYKQELMEQCPYDSHHRVPARSLEKHKASCSLRKMGYSAEEENTSKKTSPQKVLLSENTDTPNDIAGT
ncbi:U11/U12 small nuclear ribonucleoprotein 48 kDa protein [Notothenia coriiceps]|uniref:U11/U12 small nuclear ribonucleoprotein 48 kDa protein n=1 Tax=Notothenia coriiceps TaxID=8208 RepID=A0A6I9P9T5_9TELE|nr:PREDICTED: U11/U12 small nuclear ribonucleoprotein 48 kDa protein [Notothenia coriiceps]